MGASLDDVAEQLDVTKGAFYYHIRNKEDLLHQCFLRTLTLGGKSPTIITEDCDLKMAAKRLLFGKFLNAGQTCVAPPYGKTFEKMVNLMTRWKLY